MAQLFEVHPDNPQPRLLKQAVALLEEHINSARTRVLNAPLEEVRGEWAAAPSR
jgi:hypothetical protein